MFSDYGSTYQGKMPSRINKSGIRLIKCRVKGKYQSSMKVPSCQSSNPKLPSTPSWVTAPIPPQPSLAPHPSNALNPIISPPLPAKYALTNFTGTLTQCNFKSFPSPPPQYFKNNSTGIPPSNLSNRRYWCK